MDNDVIELLDILYGMISEAYRVPLGNDRCIIEREKAIEIINEIKANLPSSDLWLLEMNLSEMPRKKQRH